MSGYNFCVQLRASHFLILLQGYFLWQAELADHCLKMPSANVQMVWSRRAAR
jgi:hypothetical protein